MGNLFLKYFVENYEKGSDKKSEPGPVITVSREHGCFGKEIAQSLVKKINKKNMGIAGKPPWNLISKEIFFEASKELKIHPEQIRKLLISEEKNFIETFVASFTDKYYIHNARIIGVFKRVIRNIADNGNVVILGRGGVAITKDIPKSLHIFLEAPLEWRAVRISVKRNVSLEEAKKEIHDIDKRRINFISQIQKRGSDYTKYDLTFNCMSFTQSEICDIIIKAAEKRQII
jgi:cytidylate kinase